MCLPARSRHRRRRAQRQANLASLLHQHILPPAVVILGTPAVASIQALVAVDIQVLVEGDIPVLEVVRILVGHLARAVVMVTVREAMAEVLAATEVVLGTVVAPEAMAVGLAVMAAALVAVMGYRPSQGFLLVAVEVMAAALVAATEVDTAAEAMAVATGLALA